MFSRFAVLMLAVASGPIFAQSPMQICRTQQDSENATWARKAGLSQTDVDRHWSDKVSIRARSAFAMELARVSLDVPSLT